MMENVKPYVVVLFMEEDEAPGVISSNWIIDERNCYYPNVRTDEARDTLIRKMALPGAGWTKHAIKILNYYANDIVSKAKCGISEDETMQEIDGPSSDGNNYPSPPKTQPQFNQPSSSVSKSGTRILDDTMPDIDEPSSDGPNNYHQLLIKTQPQFNQPSSSVSKSGTRILDDTMLDIDEPSSDEPNNYHQRLIKTQPQFNQRCSCSGNLKEMMLEVIMHVKSIEARLDVALAAANVSDGSADLILKNHPIPFQTIEGWKKLESELQNDLKTRKYIENPLPLFEESDLLTFLSSGNITYDETKQVCHALETKEMSEERLGFCGYVWDEILCWPPTPPGTVVVRACMEEFRNVHYDTTKNATKQCFPNGTWANYTDYLSCLNTSHLHPHSPNGSEPGILPGTETTTLIYICGYSISLLILCAAVWIFVYFKDLRCLRNTIHINLMCTYILADAMWLLYAGVQMHIYDETASCIFFVFFLHYFHLTNFFWMFVEGLYLYMLVVETFTRENIKLRTYLAIGWGAPFIIMVAWTVTRWLISNGASVNPAPMEPPEGPEAKSCSWMSDGSLVDWIFNASALLVLAVNLLFLIMIMWVLITKLRSSNNVETQQYRKAAKALVVLIPLLGLTYIFFVLAPIEGDWAHSLHYVRAVLLSTQGFTVALLYCFLNTEVQNTVRHHFSRWKESRDIGHRRYTYSKDWSPNTRTESIRLCSKHEVAPYKKRESTVSESTTLTLVGYGGGSRLSNGSTAPSTVAVRAPVSPFLEPPREKAV